MIRKSGFMGSQRILNLVLVVEIFDCSRVNILYKSQGNSNKITLQF